MLISCSFGSFQCGAILFRNSVFSFWPKNSFTFLPAKKASKRPNPEKKTRCIDLNANNNIFIKKSYP